METIKVVFAILMIQNGSTVEMVPTEGLSDCLKQKRIISRNIGEDQEGIEGEEGGDHQERDHLPPPDATWQLPGHEVGGGGDEEAVEGGGCKD